MGEAFECGRNQSKPNRLAPAGLIKGGLTKVTIRSL